MNEIKNKILYDIDLQKRDFKNPTACYGHFNVIHAGHIRYLEYAKKLGECLIVVIQTDRELSPVKNEYLFSEYERALNLASLQIVDYVVICEAVGLESLIKVVKPKHLVLGSEFENISDLKSDIGLFINRTSMFLKKCGGTIIYHGGDVHYSKSFLNNDLSFTQDKKSIYLNACKTQKVSKDRLLNSMKNFKNSSLLVIGDTILDQYVACEPIGMSAEAPVVVMRELDDNIFLGGAGIVAANVRALGANCSYLSVVGDDQNAVTAKESLQDFGVNFDLLKDPSRPTTFKIRYLVEKQKMFRVSRLIDNDLRREIEDELLCCLEQKISSVNGILLCDFLYGVITPRVLQFVKDAAAKNNIPLYCDLQCSSQIGSILKFSGAELICPTEREARLSIGAKDDGLEWVANKVMERTGTQNLIMKLASEGFIAYERTDKQFVNRQAFPALSENPVDVTGAGDSLLAALAVGMSSGSSIMEASAIATCMAALSVENLGNTPIELDALKEKIERFH